MSTLEKTYDPRLAAELHKSVTIVGITNTSRAMGVSPATLRKLIEKCEFELEHIARARMLGFFDPPEQSPCTDETL